MRICPRVGRLWPSLGWVWPRWAAIEQGGRTCLGRVWSRMLRIWPREGGSDPRLGEVGLGWVAYGPKWTCCGYGLGRAGLTRGWVRLA